MATEGVTGLTQHLDRLKDEPGVLGALLVTRDGMPVAEALRRPLHRELFAALSATVLGAAEMALSDLGVLQVRHVVAEADKFRLMVFGLSDDHLVVLVAEPAADTEALAAKVKAMTPEIVGSLR